MNRQAIWLLVCLVCIGIARTAPAAPVFFTESGDTPGLDAAFKAAAGPLEVIDFDELTTDDPVDNIGTLPVDVNLLDAAGVQSASEALLFSSPAFNIPVHREI